MSKEIDYDSIISKFFFDRKCESGEYRVIGNTGKGSKFDPIFLVKFKNSGNVAEFKYSDIVKDNVCDKVEKVKESKSKKTSTNSNIPDNQKVDLEIGDKDVDYKIVYDTRERDLDYLKYFTPDSKRKSDNTKFVGLQRKLVMPINCSMSTGDITYEWKRGNSNWNRTNFSIEIKKELDLFSSIFSIDNYKRLLKELDRAKKAKLDFYFICDLDLTKMVELIKGMESVYVKGNFKKKQLPPNAHVIFLSKFLMLNEELTKRGFNQVICGGENMFYIIKRLIKKNLKESLK